MILLRKMKVRKTRTELKLQFLFAVARSSVWDVTESRAGSGRDRLTLYILCSWLLRAESGGASIEFFGLLDS